MSSHLLVLEDGRWTPWEGPIQDAPRPCWFRATTDADLQAAARVFSLHGLALEDVWHDRQRPKVEEYDEYIFAVVRAPVEAQWHQVGLFIGPDWLVTASDGPSAQADVVEQRLLTRRSTERDVGAVAYRILDGVVDEWFPTIDELEREIEGLEDNLVETADLSVLGGVRHVKRECSRLRKVLIPMRDAIIELERGDDPFLSDRSRVYLRDVSDHTTRLAERLAHVRELAFIAQETWNSALAKQQADTAHQQNEQMRRLTVVAALLLFPGLLAGMAGMNFEGVPDWPFAVVASVILGLVAVGFALAAWRGWL